MTTSRRLNATLAICALGLSLFLDETALADGFPDITGEAGADAYEIVGEAANDPTVQAGEPVGANGVAPDKAPIVVEYRWVSVCTSPDAAAEPSTVLDCAAARACPDGAERLWHLWGRSIQPARWFLLGSECFGRPPSAADTPKPRITPGLVLNAIRRIGLPELTARTQPADKTLVNFATIFYAEPQPFARSLRLLGQGVDVEATPVRYTWHHGDGTSATTSSPGAPYPSQEITYSYTDAHTTVRPSVDVTYTARFRVNGGAWQDIVETVTIAGPASALRVSEATAVLSGNYG